MKMSEMYISHKYLSEVRAKEDLSCLRGTSDDLVNPVESIRRNIPRRGWISQRLRPQNMTRTRQNRAKVLRSGRCGGQNAKRIMERNARRQTARFRFILLLRALMCTKRGVRELRLRLESRILEIHNCALRTFFFHQEYIKINAS